MKTRKRVQTFLKSLIRCYASPSLSKSTRNGYKNIEYFILGLSNVNEIALKVSQSLKMIRHYQQNILKQYQTGCNTIGEIQKDLKRKVSLVLKP